MLRDSIYRNEIFSTHHATERMTPYGCAGLHRISVPPRPVAFSW
jgi:hypothetical protein